MLSFDSFKWFAETIGKIYQSIEGKRAKEWQRLGDLFDEIANVLDSIATKFLGKVVPREELLRFKYMQRNC